MDNYVIVDIDLVLIHSMLYWYEHRPDEDDLRMEDLCIDDDDDDIDLTLEELLERLCDDDDDLPF